MALRSTVESASEGPLGSVIFVLIYFLVLVSFKFYSIFSFQF